MVLCDSLNRVLLLFQYIVNHLAFASDVPVLSFDTELMSSES